MFLCYSVPKTALRLSQQIGAIAELFSINTNELVSRDI